ncbi:hypothetical protein [Marinomonas sp.]|uniref:hypothetical protein n=1 Tax=Marinomonas sp. TaxID=1904862 RepID=UPI003BA9A781
MVFLNFFIGFFALFLSPQIYLRYKFPLIKNSIVSSFSLIFSFTAIWFLTLLSTAFKISDLFFQILSYFIFICSIYFSLKSYNKIETIHFTPWVWLLALTLSSPLWFYIGDVFTSWDAVASWNRWGIELANNNYHPEGTAYPILVSSMFSMLYKLQGTTDIWWTVKLSLYVLPVVSFLIPIFLYIETRNKTFLISVFCLYSYAINAHSISGYTDIPVMLFGFLSLILLYAADLYKEKTEFYFYISSALLFAGLCSIVKQAGLAFLLFNFVFLFFNRKCLKRSSIFIIFLLSMSYFTSFLIWYFIYNNNPISNLSHLRELSSSTSDRGAGFWDYPNYFSGIITLLMIIISFYLYRYDSLRRFASISFLSGLFFIIGLLIWWSFFSYDGRNSAWVKSFLILSFSINLAFFLDNHSTLSVLRMKLIFFNFKERQHLYHLLQKINFLPLLYFFTFFIISASFFLLDNEFLEKVQRDGQSKIGNMDVGKKIRDLVVGKANCVKIISIDIPLTYNYYTRSFRERFIYGQYSKDTLIHSCKDGRYFVFGQWEVDGKDWANILEAERLGFIKEIGKRTDLIYFAPLSSEEKN